MTNATGDVPMQDPIAFFLTCATYGTWLPGDQRGWIEYHHGWQLPRLNLERHCQTKMSEKQCLLSPAQRLLVTAQAEETCGHRGWTLFAVDCRSNHAHFVVGAFNTDAKKIRIDLKAWCTRRLKKDSKLPRDHWWAERGSIRWVWDEDSLAKVIEYVTEAQNRKDLDHPP